MGTRKKGSELVFNLQWRNKPDNGGDKSNVIGMYDVPATTVNFETFKSYLLKNSGVVCNDVKVTYLTDNGAEWPVDSQEWFEIALCAFRLKARLGEVIFLKLDKINNSPNSHHLTRKHSNDVETQFDDSINNVHGPPEWFLSYMKQFKRDIMEEVRYTVSANLTTTSKDKEPAPIVVVPKKMKPECSKRSRKHMIVGENPIDKCHLPACSKDILKTLKYDRKIEIRLDKLDAKTKKIKEKKQALINRIEGEDHHRCPHKQQSLVDGDGAPLMNAALVSDSTAVPHMVGGETYMHRWEVANNGKLPWTPNTELRLTWGSADMKPFVNAIRCPPLAPGERGTVCVRFYIPKKPGQYESYWNFYEKEVRFGHWVSCRVIVDAPVSAYPAESAVSKKPKMDQEPASTPEKPNTPKHFVSQDNFIIIQDNPEPEVEGAAALASSVMDLSRRMQDVQIVGTTAPQVDSDSDWESVYCARNKDVEDQVLEDFDPLKKTNKYGINEKDLIVDLSTTKSPEPKPETPVKGAEKEENSNDDNNNNGGSVNNNSTGESICEVASEASDLSSGYDVLNTPMSVDVREEEGEGSGYVYITIDGNKLPVPKHMIRPDFLANVEEAPIPAAETEDKVKDEVEEPAERDPTPPTVIIGNNDHIEPAEATKHTVSFMKLMQGVNAPSTCFADAKPGQHTRVFIFPQDNPGFEVLYYPKGVGDGKEEDGAKCPWEKISYYPNGMKDDQSDNEDNGCQRNADENAEAEPENYTWSQSETQYTFPDMQSACAAAHLKCDPYGPLDQSRPASSQGPKFQHVPNYQQTPRSKPKAAVHAQGARPASEFTPSAPVHILPENLVSGAVNVASSAINTARSVISMIVPPKTEGGKWVNGHWVTENPESTRAKNLRILADMGFWDTDLNATLLARYNDDVSRVVTELLH